MGNSKWAKQGWICGCILVLLWAVWLREPSGAGAQTCTFALTLANQNLLAGGGRGSVSVSAGQPGCAWTAVSNAPWITISAGASGSGNGAVSYTVAPNPAATPRTGTLTIAGQTFTVSQAAGIGGLQFYPLAKPIRLFDTRGNNPNFPPCAFTTQPLSADSETVRSAHLTCDGVTIPASAQSIVGNATVVSPQAGGFITLFPTGQPRPPISNLNYTTNELVQNAFTVGLDSLGRFTIYTVAPTHFVVDVTGYFAPPGAESLYYHPLPVPLRLLDTRAFNPSFPACVSLNQPLGANLELLQTARLTCQGVTIPTDALALVGNATVTGTQGAGFLTLFPDGQARPPVATLSYQAGQTVTNAFTLGLDAQGEFRAYSAQQTHLVVDVAGYYSASAQDVNGPGLLYNPLTRPLRLFDTRAPIPGFQACDYLNQPLLANSELARTGRLTCNGLTIPSSALAIEGNATVAGPQSGGFITLFPDGAARPPVSNLNYAAAQTVTNGFVTGLSNAGSFRTYTFAGTQFIVDVSGYFVPAPANQTPLAAAGPDQTISLPMTNITLAGTVTDDGLPSGALNSTWSKLSGPGTVSFDNASQVLTTATFSAPGVYVLRLTADDGLLAGSDEVQITVSSGLAVNAGADQVVTLPNTGLLTGTVSGGLPPVNLVWSSVSGPSSVLFSNASAAVTYATFALSGTYVLRLSATDAQGTISDDIQIIVNADPTPPPVISSPPLDMSVATNVGDATEFLYTGPSPIQTGVAAGTIQKGRAAVLKGRVLDKNNNPLSLVKVTVLNHPEYGQTLSRADGKFDLVVNGGGVLNVQYEKVGYLKAQRQENVPWQDYCGVPDVVLIGFDSNVTPIDLSLNTPIHVAQGSVMTDAAGTRRARLIFPQGTTATLKLPGGALVGLNKFSVRATEFTVSTNGPETMPAGLPPTSAYTYAAEFSLDEAVTAGALETTFNQPVLQYNENFLNFPVGTAIPSGSYDTQQGVWIPSANGRVVKVLSINAGLVNLDVNGAGQPATDPEYAALGISVAERQTLATLYAVNQSLWRVPHMHFSTIDANWPGGPIGAVPTPNGGTAKNNSAPPKNQDKNPCGSVIGCQGQTLSETLKLVGSPFTLHYSSDRVPGRQAEYTITIPLSGGSVPASLQRIDLEVSVAGQIFRQSYPPTANQTTTFTWDGKDAYGRTVQGNQTATVTVGFVYNGVYYNTVGFGFSGNGVPLNSNPTRREVTLLRPMPVMVGAFDARGQRLGGWTLSAHHVYDPVGKTLYLGTGERRIAEKLYPSMTTVAGSGLAGFSGDGGQALQARLNRPWGVGVGLDGSLYIGDTFNNRVRKVAPDGVISSFAGTGVGGYGGDNGPATAALLNFPSRAQVGPDGSVYIDDRLNNRVRRVSPSGIITTFAGTGIAGFSGDGGPATQAMLNQDPDPFPFRDGSVYITDIVNHRVRRVMPDGIIRTIAGNGTAAFSGDGGPATQASLNLPVDLALQADGTVYISDLVNNRIRRVGVDGIITTVAGGGVSTGDGIPATQASLRLDTGCDMALAPDGAVYFTERIFHRVRRLGTDSILTTVAGNGTAGFSGDGGPATQAQLNTPFGLGVARDGSLYIGDSLNHRIRRVAAPLPGFNSADIAIPSEDGSELYQFDKNGRHLRTLNALTGATLLTFTYNAAGLLTQISDTENNVTTIQRDGAGNPTAIIAPFGQQTTLALNANGFLSQVTDPANQTHQMSYTPGGLLTGFTDPRNNTSTMTYDALGRLSQDTNAANGSIALARTDAPGTYTVTETTALNRVKIKQVENLATGEERRTNTGTNGLQTDTLRGTDEKSTTTQPDGTVTTVQEGPDPRFGIQALLETSLSLRLPSGLTLNRTVTRSVTLSDSTNLLSLVSQTTTSNLNGRNFISTYTAANRKFLYSTPLNRQTMTIIDLLGRPTQRQFANLNATDFSYDARGRLTTVTQGAGGAARTMTLAYNSGGFLASVTDALNRVNSFSYDLAGRVTQRTLPDGRVVGFGYDANGNLTSLTPPGRPAHVFAFTPLNQTSSYTPPTVAGTGQTTYAFNLDRQLTTVTRPDAQTLAFAYDSAGRLSTLTVPSGQYAYNYSATTGNLADITAPGGGALSFAYDGSLLTQTSWSGIIAGSVSRVFDNNFRVTSQSINGANTINLTYDNDGLLTGAGNLSLTRNAQTGFITATTLGNVSDSRSYTGFGEVATYSSSFNAASFYAVSFTYDKLSRITQKVETISGLTDTFDYDYDLAGRLTQVKKNSVVAATYSYDSNGNRLSYTGAGPAINGTYDNQDRLTQYGTATYSYTANGELANKTTGAQVTAYQYDVIGNLRQATLPDGTQIDYVIDGQNRRIGKKVNGVLMQGFLYQNALTPVAELDGSNNIVSRFVYASRANVPDYVIRDGSTYRILCDHLGSPRLVIDVVTGNVVQRMDYDEFGVVVMDTNPGFQPFGFAGGLYDTDTGLVRFGARDYDAQTGRWTVKDPILFEGGDTNLYGYVLNDPINFDDFTGLKATKSGSDTPGVFGNLVEELVRAKRSEVEVNREFLEGLTGCETVEELREKLNNLERELHQIQQYEKKLETQIRKLGLEGGLTEKDLDLLDGPRWVPGR